MPNLTTSDSTNSTCSVLDEVVRLISDHSKGLPATTQQPVVDETLGLSSPSIAFHKHLVPPIHSDTGNLFLKSDILMCLKCRFFYFSQFMTSELWKGCCDTGSCLSILQKLGETFRSVNVPCIFIDSVLINQDLTCHNWSRGKGESSRPGALSQLPGIPIWWCEAARCLGNCHQVPWYKKEGLLLLRCKVITS